MVLRSLNTSTLPDTTTRCPGVNTCGGRANHTSSMKPEASRHSTRHGRPFTDGASWDTTSSASVATVPGTASATRGLLRRSM